VAVASSSFSPPGHQLGQSEVENLADSLVGNEDICWLDVAMDDALLVCGPQTITNLNADVQQLFHWKRFRVCGGGRQPLAQGLPFQ